MRGANPVAFHSGELGKTFCRMPTAQVGPPAFEGIGSDSAAIVSVYDKSESYSASSSHDRATSRCFFISVSRCMSSYIVSQRFEGPMHEGATLDENPDYVSTPHMHRVKALLQSLTPLVAATQLVLVNRLVHPSDA